MSFFLSSPDSEGEKTLPDPDIPAAVAPSSETPVPETPTADTSTQELPQVEENIAVPSGKDEEEHISSTITLLDKEEELDEGKEKGDYHERQQEIQNFCSPLPSFSSFCSCATSLQEYLHQQCSALLSKKRKCQAMYKKQMIPSIETPAWHRPLSPSACPEPQQHHSEVHQPHEKEQAAEQEPESRASLSETPQPPENTAVSHKESMLEPPLLEPSQTSNLPKPSATDSSSAKPTPIVETPQLSSEEPEKNEDVLAKEKRIEPSASLSSSSDVQPTVGATVNDPSVAPAEEKSDTDVSQPEINAPVKTPDNTGISQVLHPTTFPHLEHHPDPPVVPESETLSSEVANPVPDIITELEPSGDRPVITETKTENFSEDVSASSPSPVAPPSSLSSPTSPSLSDIYADPPNGTEQNGNPVHGSSQKESVFMRLNNRIKALEMNMSLSGRYLEQLSQRWETGTHTSAAEKNVNNYNLSRGWY